MKIGFIGLGLIGGSLAKAIRRYYPECEIVAFNKSKESLALACQEQVVDISCASVDGNFKNCDYIFLCAPVSDNITYLKQIQKYITDDCILTDVGSVKTPIHEEIAALGMEENFIGGHPMAGSEKTGYPNSKAILLENAYYILTPTKKVSQKKVERYAAFVESLKALPIILDYETHDYVTGSVSHLPHIIASGLVNFVKEEGSEELMKKLAAGGFKDITRIASSSPIMWQQICLENRRHIIPILEKYICFLEQFKHFVENGDGESIYEIFLSSKEYRNSISDVSAGSIKKVFALYCDIADEAGELAKITNILAGGNISLKNIGIIHNREFEESVLRIEFYDESAAHKAGDLLQKNGYTIYER
ncbi:MAG: prephenate dehydrogenase [Methanimicrococcus sp.]|nr:prephenate dehydrogenase [Methanimicrococcus sp.]